MTHNAIARLVGLVLTPRPVSVRVTRKAQASWQGDLADGGGRIGLGSGAFEGPFTLRARVEDVERATNPEELIGAAHAGCFTMSLANRSARLATRPADLRTTAQRPAGAAGERVHDHPDRAEYRRRVPGVDADDVRASRRAGQGDAARSRERSPAPRSPSRRVLPGADAIASSAGRRCAVGPNPASRAATGCWCAPVGPNRRCSNLLRTAAARMPTGRRLAVHRRGRGGAVRARRRRGALAGRDCASP